ncbi:hypothetical protein HAPAU_34090 [Halalkalicoccus paucihalophilus]|uniref:Uncharacterized protein n=1 Tax=Halalkalicoccus paucihalophilus TaxID=1008153 RepID=A0A151A9P4_9EURY|nr:hypothetical protein HAPAU_34090 [Halalkalicoccus paucihalophilus]
MDYAPVLTAGECVDIVVSALTPPDKLAEPSLSPQFGSVKSAQFLIFIRQIVPRRSDIDDWSENNTMINEYSAEYYSIL